jgi:hypothetical protein
MTTKDKTKVVSAGPGAVLDLSEYTLADMQEEVGPSGYHALLIKPGDDVPSLSTYYAPAYAMADVSYSRLCAYLGLPCVKSRYAKNLPKDSAPDIVSVSDYSPDWEPYGIFASDGKSPRNAEELSQHKLLSYLTQNAYWTDDDAGFVTKDGDFIRGNCGSLLGSFGLHALLSGRDCDGFFSPLSVSQVLMDFTLSDEEMSLLSRLGSIPEDEVADIVRVPKWAVAEDGEVFIKQRIRHAKFIAKRVCEAVADHGKDGAKEVEAG